MTGSNDQSDDNNRDPEFAMQAMTQDLMRLLDQRLEPLLSRMDRIDGGGSQSVHNEHNDENDVEQSLRQNPNAYLSWESKVKEEDDVKFTENGEILVVKRSLKAIPT